MAVTISGDGTITGISQGGLPDDCVDAGTIKDADYQAPLTAGTDYLAPTGDGSSLTNLPDEIDSKGSNANGNYIKFKGGTLICWATLSFGSCSNSNAGGWYCSDTNTWTYPIAFNSTPAVSVINYGGHYNHMCGKCNSAGNTSAGIRSLNPTSTSNQQDLQVMAIGRWS